MSTDEDTRLLRAVAAHGLTGAPPPLPPRPLDDAAWQRLLAGAAAQRLQGQLAAAVSADALPTTAGQRAQAAETHVAAMAVAVSLERLLCEVDEAFEAAHVPLRVLKGPAGARLDYADPSLRSFGDIDLLVPAERLQVALEALGSLGCRRDVPELRRGFDRRFAKSVTVTAPNGFELDIHRTLALDPLGLAVRTEDLWDPGARFTLGGRTFLALPAEQRLLHACYHAMLDARGSALTPLRDVAEMTLHGKARPDRVLELADRWGGAAVAAQAISTAWEAFTLPDAVHLSEWAMRYRPTAWERRALLVHSPGGRRQARKALVALPLIHGLVDKAAYLRALLVPEREFVRQRGVGYGAWIRRGARGLRSADGRS